MPPSRAARRAGAAVLAVILLSIIALPCAESDGGSGGLVRLYEVNPFNSEGFSLFNYGSSAADLKGMQVTDGEGRIDFTAPLLLGPGERLTVITGDDTGAWFAQREHTVHVGEQGIIKSGSFILANAGDDVTLLRGTAVADAVCYGDKTAAAGWEGEPVPISSGRYLLRTGIFDTDSAADWVGTKPGHTSLPFEPAAAFPCEVAPFTFPESAGAPVYETLAAAEEEVLISLYMISSRNMIALLIDLEQREGDAHVDVRVIIEGRPLGQDTSTELMLLRSLVDAGGEVWVINGDASDGYSRYTYFHNKYAVVDGERVVVTSENWTTANLSGSRDSNRGWGAVIDGEGYAEYMASVWESDRDGSYGDVVALEELYPDLSSYGGILTYTAPEACDLPTYGAEVVPVLSPDNSHGALRLLMEGAEDRIWSEQLSLGSSYALFEDDSPVRWMHEAALRGADSRLILDGSNGDVSAAVNQINALTDVRACSIDGGEGFTTNHNKGVLIDDSITWLGSVNWTDTSFRNNREVAAVIVSTEVNAFFSGYFLTDWESNTLELAELEISVETLSSPHGPIYSFIANGHPSLEYSWVLDGIEAGSHEHKLVRKGLAAGEHRLSVTVDGTSLSSVLDFVVPLPEAAGADLSDGDIPAYIAAVLIAIASIGAALLRRRAG